MNTIICITNLAGKSGKTFTAVNLSASLAVLEKRTLLVDCDPMGMASRRIPVCDGEMDYGLSDILSGIVGGTGGVVKTRLPFLDLIPSGKDLASVEKSLRLNKNRDRVLSIVIEKFRSRYDFILFDTPSEEGFLTKSAVLACDSLLIPVDSGSDIMENLTRTIGYAGELRQKKNTLLKISGILFNRCRDLHDAADTVFRLEFEPYKSAVFPVTIPPSHNTDNPQGLPVCLVDVKSETAEAFLDLSFEFLYRERKK